MLPPFVAPGKPPGLWTKRTSEDKLMPASNAPVRKPPGLKRWPASRAEAMKKGYRRYYTGVKCQRGHLSERHTTTGGCVECLKEDRKGPRREYRRRYAIEYNQRKRDEYRKVRDQREA